MTINEYQKLAMTTRNPALSERDVLLNGVMGLCGESGEAIDIVKKWLAQGHELDKAHLAKELGDIAWYLAETATEHRQAQGALSGGLQHREIASPQGTRSVIWRLSHEHRKPF